MCPARVTAVAGPGPICTVPSSFGAALSWSSLLGAYSSQPLGWEAGSPAAQGSLVRVIGSPPGTQGSSEWGQGKEDAELQEAEAATPGAGRSIRFREGRKFGLYGRRGSVFVTWLGRCPYQSFLSSPRGTPRCVLGLHTQTVSQKEEVSSGSHKSPLKAHPVPSWNSSFIFEFVWCHRFEQDGSERRRRGRSVGGAGQTCPPVP